MEPEEKPAEIEVVDEEDDDVSDEESIITSSTTTTDNNINRILNYRVQPVIVKEENRITMSKISDYEFTNIITQRIKNIETTGKALCTIGDLSNPRDIAIKELIDRKCPFKLRRQVGHRIDHNKKILYNFYELWDVNNMSYPAIFNMK